MPTVKPFELVTAMRDLVDCNLQDEQEILVPLQDQDLRVG